MQTYPFTLPPLAFNHDALTYLEGIEEGGVLS